VEEINNNNEWPIINHELISGAVFHEPPEERVRVRLSSSGAAIEQ